MKIKGTSWAVAFMLQVLSKLNPDMLAHVFLEKIKEDPELKKVLEQRYNVKITLL